MKLKAKDGEWREFVNAILLKKSPLGLGIMEVVINFITIEAKLPIITF
jgi:hypothetical protein